jgi:hypothetical protein
VVVAVRGGRRALGAVDAAQLEPFVDAAGLAPGHYQLRVKVDAPDACVIDSIDPATIAVNIQ